jgi:hypothetical protein
MSGFSHFCCSPARSGAQVDPFESKGLKPGRSRFITRSPRFQGLKPRALSCAVGHPAYSACTACTRTVLGNWLVLSIRVRNPFKLGADPRRLKPQARG